MYKYIFFSILILLMGCNVEKNDTLSHNQTKIELKWWNPADSKIYAIQGQGWHSELAEPYDRLPIRVRNKLLLEPVWRLSRESAGLIIRFRTNAEEIHVRYAVSFKLRISIMPATGVSGVDLYSLDKSGHWVWHSGNYSFGDTITYDFSHLQRGNSSTRNYYLYLPLYNHVRWLEIGIPQKAKLVPQSPSTKRPIVVYGTSIAQGAAASRPGLAWPAILGRQLHRPVINLGFSGHGRLEPPIIDLMKELNAKIYILDCMPNMWYPYISSDTVRV